MHRSRSAARRHRRRLASGWVPPSPDDPLPPVVLERRGARVEVSRTVGSPRRDLFVYSKSGDVVGLTFLAKHQGFRLP